MLEILKNIKQSANERIKNPFIGSFIFSWIIINWRPILILILSDENIYKKINYINFNYNNLKTYFLYPFFISIFYVIVLPYLMAGFEYLVSFARKFQGKNLTQTKIEELKNQKIIIEQQIQNEKAITEYKDRESINQQIEILKQNSLEKDKQINEYTVLLENQRLETDKIKELNIIENIEKQKEKDNLIEINSELQKQINDYKLKNIELENLKIKLEAHNEELITMYNDENSERLRIEDIKVNIENEFLKLRSEFEKINLENMSLHEKINLNNT